MEVRSTLSAACAISFLPTGVEPVKLSLRSRWSEIRRAASEAGDDVVTTLTTPAGTPASVSSWQNSSALSGVSSAGLTTTVQPAASVGAILRVATA